MLQSSPYKQPFSFPRRFRRGTRWLVRSLYFPVFSADSESSIAGLTISSLLVPAAHIRPSFCILASLTPNRGVGGAPIRPPLGFLSICFGLENPKKVPIPSAFVVFQDMSQCYIVLHAEPG